MSAARPAPSSRRILIVDDEVDNRELLQIVLNWAGFETVTAGDGDQALHSALGEPPDLMLVDLMMPGIDGYQLVAELKRHPTTQHIPIIMLSAMNDSATRARALSSGAEACLSKPIDRSELCEQVRSILGLEAAPQ